MRLALVCSGFSLLLILALAGCGSGGSPVIAVAGPIIITQPANQSVPMGLDGGFSVQASGSNLRYQWSRNGSAIAGATASSYTTPATVFSDSGSNFTVVVSNSTGSAKSNPALLTVTARAPKAGDLRFQQVDAPSTVNGYGVASIGYSGATIVACPPPGGGGYSVTLNAATGTDFFLVNNLCIWQFEPHALPAGVSGLEVGYAGVAMQDYPGVLDGSELGGFPSPSDPGSVITSLIFVPAGNGAGLGFIHSDNSTGFDRTQYTVAASALQNAVAQEGLRGRVVTAVSYDGTNATFFSYGWTGDPSTVYESQVVFATLDTATGLAEGLANDGYIITTTGQTQAADGSGVVLIGTRVQGDTIPRPFLVGSLLEGTLDPVFAQGYATVGVVTKLGATGLVLKNYLGER